MEFNIYRLVAIIVIILSCFLICRKNCDSVTKLFFLLFFSFLTVYCGIGGALTDVSPLYVNYLILYVVFFTATFKFWQVRGFRNRKSALISSSKNERMVKIVDTYGGVVIILFFVLNLLSLVYPENNLSNLIHPPIPDISNRLSFYENKGNYITIFNVIKILLSPFFYMCLYKYRRQLLFVIILLFLDMYMTYCAESYSSRGVILQVLMVAFFSYYYSVSKEKQRRVLIISLSAFPFLIIAFVLYSFARVGNEYGVSISIGDAFELLFSQEISYPLQFDDYIKSSGALINNYFLWFFLQPLPSFMKFGLGEDIFNEIFTNVVYNSYSWQSDFSICLPGLVGESIFIFKYYFYLHAILLATILYHVLRFLRRRPYLFFLFLYYAIKFAQELPRGGTQSVYSSLSKGFLIFVIVLVIIEKSNRQIAKEIVKRNVK